MAKKAKNIGVIYESEVKLNNQVSNKCTTGIYYVINLAIIRKLLDLKTAEIAASAFATSSLDYVYVLLHFLPKNLILKIQLVQNSSAGVIVNLSKHDPITPARK